MAKTQAEKERDARRAESRKSLKDVAAVYVRREDNRRKRKTASPENIHQERLQDLETYSGIIQTYCQNHPDDWKDIQNKDAKKLLADYDRFVIEGAGASAGNINLNEYTRATAGLKEEDEAVTIPDNISPEQKKGLTEVGIWLRTQADGSKYIAFTQQVFNLPARARLLVYFLIERKKYRAPSLADLAESQMSYVPNPGKVQQQLFNWSHKMHLGSKFYWNKLEAALETARSNDVMKMLGTFGEMGESDTSSGGGGAADTQQQQTQELTPEQKELRRKATELKQLVTRRNVLSAKFIQSGISYRKFLEEAGKAAKGKDRERQELLYTFVSNYLEMQQIDAIVAQKIGENSGQNPQIVDEKKSNEKTQEKYDNIGDANEIAGLILDPTGIIGEADKFVAWGLPKFAESNMNVAGNVFGSALAVTQIISLVVQCRNLTAMAKFMSTADIAESVANIGVAAVQIINSGIGLFGSEALNNVAGPLGSIVTGTASVAIGAYQMWKAEERQEGVHGSIRSLNKNRNVSNKDKNTLAQIDKLNQRVTDSQETSGAMQMASGALSITGGILAASGVLAPISAILVGIGSIISIADSIRKYRGKKRNQLQTIDEYIKMNELYTLVVRGFEAQGKGDLVSDKEDVCNEIRDDVRSMFGYATNTSFYNFIVNEYAAFLYNKTFHPADNPNVYIVNPNPKKGEEFAKEQRKQNQYANIVYSLTGQLTFPTSASTPPSPTADTIAGKLGG